MAKIAGPKLDTLKEVSSRIKWKSVLAVLIVLAIVLLVFRNIPSGYTVKDDVGLKAYANPDTIKLDGRTSLEIEIKNTGQERGIETLVSANAYDQNIIFTNTSSTSVELSVKIGPKEVRKLSFEIQLSPGALEGTYCIDVTVKPEGRIEGVKVPVCIPAEK